MLSHSLTNILINSNSSKGELEMQKLHGVGKFFNEWWADLPPPFPPKKENISPKKEVTQKKIRKLY